MPLKIAFVEAAARPFGSSRSLFTLIKHLDRSRFTPLVACNQHNALISWCRDEGITAVPLSLSEEGGQQDDILKPARIAAAPGPLCPSIKDRAMLPIRILRDWRQYSKVIAELKSFTAKQQIDVIHCNNQPSTNRFAYLARGGRPVVQHIRDAPLTRSLHMAHLSDKCTHLFSISDYVRKDAISALGLDPKAISTLYNPIGDEFFFDKECAAQQRRLWNIEEGQIVFGIAGRLIPWKGVDRAISAFNDLCREPGFEEKSRLVIVGASETPTNYEDQCRKLAGDRLGRSIQILPFTKNVPQVFNGFDAVLHPIQKPEGFGRVIVEGMACGAPPLGRGLGALPELIEDGVNGRLFMEDDELITVMRSVVSSPESLAQMKQNAIASAERFRPARLVRDFEQKYSDLFLNSHRT